MFARVVDDLFRVVETRGLSKLDGCGSSDGRSGSGGDSRRSSCRWYRGCLESIHFSTKGLVVSLKGLDLLSKGCQLVE